MLKILMGFALAAAFLLGLENHRSTQLQAWRTAEQGKLLDGLLALGRPAVSQLVADWLAAQAGSEFADIREFFPGQGRA